MKIFLVDAIDEESKQLVKLKLVRCDDCTCLLLAADVQRLPLYDAKGKDCSRVVCMRCYNDWRRDAFEDPSE